MMRAVLSVALLLGAVSWASAAEPAAEKPLRAAIVTGVDHPAHPWKETGPVLRSILEKDARIEARIFEDPEVLGTDLLDDYDVLVLHFKNYKPLAREEKAQAKVKSFVESGKGLVVIHFGSGAWEEWPEFQKISGMVWDRKTGHDPRGPYTVRITDREHPITKGMEDFSADDELYTCLVGEQACKVLAVARSSVTGKDHPMAFTFSCGKGRVFHTPLGHDVKSMNMPGVAELFRRGCLWSASRLP